MAHLPEGPGIVIGRWEAIVEVQGGIELNICNTNVLGLILRIPTDGDGNEPGAICE